jgi:hypothetical protein
MKIPAGSVPPTGDPQYAGYVIEFRQQVEFLENMARMAWVDSPESEKKGQEEKFAEFSKLGKSLEKELDAFTFQDFKDPGPSFTPMLVKFAIFIYLSEKVGEFHKAALKINKDGLYALHDAVRNWTQRLLSGDYFRRDANDIIREYIFSEAQFVAMAELTGVELISIQEAASVYQKNVFDRLEAIAKEAEKKGGKKGADKAAGGKASQPEKEAPKEKPAAEAKAAKAPEPKEKPKKSTGKKSSGKKGKSKK